MGGVGTWILQQLRQIAFFLDNIVYSFISSAYELIIYLANLDLVSSNTVFRELVGRIYLLLGIFMLFKVAFSILQYLVDPNAFSDKTKGFGKLITNAMVSVVLLATTPFIFSKAYDFQEIIISSNVINNLILGTTSEDYYYTTTKASNGGSYTVTDTVRQMATDVQFGLFSAFYTLNTHEEYGVSACDPSETGRNTNVIGSVDMAQNEECMNAFVTDVSGEMKDYSVKLTDMFKTMDSEGNISDERSFAALGNLLNWQKVPDGEFSINYTPIISTLVGGYLLLLLVTFCIDIAARAIKLMFLQAVAPIAIVSYIDPKESIGQSKLKNWAKNCLTTYGSLFLRLAVIFLAIRLVDMITSMFFWPTVDGDGNLLNGITFYGVEPGQTPNVDGFMNIFIYVFLVLGIFTFAKQAPKMIEEIFGIKMSGEMSLNPFKAISSNAGATALIGGAVGLGASAISTIGMAKELYKGQGALGALKGARDFVGGTVSGAIGGAAKGLTSQGKGYVGKGASQGGRTAWNMYERQNNPLNNRVRNRWSQVTGTPMDAYTSSQTVEEYKNTTDNFTAMKKSFSEYAHTEEGRTERLSSGQNFVYYEENLEATKKRYNDALKDKNSSPAQIAAAQAAFDAAQSSYAWAEDEWGELCVKNGRGAPYIAELDRKNRQNRNLDGYDGSSITTYKAAKKLEESVSEAKTNLTSSKSYQASIRSEKNEDRQGRVGFRKHNQNRQ